MNFKKILFVLGVLLACTTLPLLCAEQSERLDSPGLRIEFLESEISRLSVALELCRTHEGAPEVIAEIEKKIDNLKQHKILFVEVLQVWSQLDEEARQLSESWETKDHDELLSQISLNEASKAQWFKRVSELCDAHDAILEGNGQNQTLPFFLKDITFLGKSNLLHLDALGENDFHCLPISLSTITGRENDISNTIFQLKVASQSNYNGGNASCGYQALKNSIILSQAVLCKTEDQIKILSQLRGVQLTRLLYGHSSSPWRSEVIIQRKKYLIKNFIRNLLLLVLQCCRRTIVGLPTLHVDARDENRMIRPTDREFCVAINCFFQGQWMLFDPYNESWMKEGYDTKIMFGYLSLINDLQGEISGLVDELDIRAEQTAPIEISGKRLIKLIIEKIRRKKNRLLKQDPDLAALGNHEPYEIDCTMLSNEELIKQYFKDIEQIKILINRGIKDLSTEIEFDQSSYQEYLVHGKFGNGNAGLAGEWAAQEEIRKILHTEITNGLLQAPRLLGANIMPFFAGDGNDSFTGTLRFEIADGVFEYDSEFIKIRTLLADETSHAVIPIILRLPGHWITLVVNKVAKDKQYIIADSVNASRINSKNIRELIALLEGLQEPLAAPHAQALPSSSNDAGIRLGSKRPQVLHKNNNENKGSGCAIL